MVLAWAAGLAVGQEPESVLLAPRLQAGDTALVEVVKDVKQTTTGGLFNEAPIHSTSQQGLGLRTRLESEPTDGGLVLVGTFERVSSRIDVLGNKWNFDSETAGSSDPTNPLAVVLGQLLGGTIRLRLDAAGVARSCEGMAEVLAQMEAAVADNGLAGQFLGEVKRNFDDEAMKFLWGDCRTVLYPGREVKVGDTWQASLRRPTPFVGALVRDYTCGVRRIGDQNGRRVVIVDYKAELRVAPDAEPEPMGGQMAIKYQGGRLTGTATFDVELGLFTEQTEEVTDRRTMDYPAQGQTTGPQTVVMEQTLRTTIKVSDIARPGVEKTDAAPADATRVER